MVECTLVYPYYRNPKMLELQVENWNRMGGELRQSVRVVLVDDHSPEPAEPIFRECRAVKTLLRFTKPGLWTMHEARNLGAIYGMKDERWMFMSDIDIIVTPEMLYTLLDSRLDNAKHYTFDRVFAHDLMFHKPHCNTFMVRRSAFMRVNGYDVDFCGLYGGGYGGDGEFIRQLSAFARPEVRKDIVLIGHERASVEDANTTQWDREEWKKKYRAVFDRKRRSGDMRSKMPVRRPWEKVF